MDCKRASGAARVYTSGVAEPARRPPQIEEPPDFDPAAIERSYREHRARRHARVEHRRRAKVASLRFWIVLWLLLVLCVIAALTIWEQISQLFGL